jgi:histidinol-phosphate aminotransferase
MNRRNDPIHMTNQENAQPDRPVHGGIKPADLRDLGLRPEDVLDFSASISPIGPPRGVWQAMERVELAAYPDPHCLELKEALAGHLSIPSDSIRSGSAPTVNLEQILVGNGSTEIIHLLARAYLPTSPGVNAGENRSCALILTPTYGEYLGACSLQGAAVSTLDAGPPPDFAWDLVLAARLIESQTHRLVFLCNPNNPTGSYLDRSDIEILAAAADRAGALLVLDEAYLSFVENPWESLAMLNLDNVVILRSMTKDYALTGLRIGYCLATEPVIARLAAYQPDWSVSSLAQAGALAALADSGYLARSRSEVARSKEFLIQRLNVLEFPVPPSAANFLLAEVGDAPSYRDKLARKGMFVRDCTSFGLPEYIRIGIRSLPDCQRLIQVMEGLA